MEGYPIPLSRIVWGCGRFQGYLGIVQFFLGPNERLEQGHIIQGNILQERLLSKRR